MDLSIILSFLIRFLQILYTLVQWIFIIYVILSWFARGRSPLGDWIARIVHPLVKPFRWARIGRVDLSLIASYFFITIAMRFIIRMVMEYGATLS